MKPLRLLIVLIVASVGAATLTACGSDNSASDTFDLAEVAEIATESSEIEAASAIPEPDAADSSEAKADAPETDQTSESENAGPDDQAPTQFELGEADWDGLTEWNLPAIGGLRMGVPEGLVVHHDADMVLVRSEFALDSGRYDPMLMIAQVNQSPSGLPLDVASFTTAAIKGVGTAVPTNTTLEIVGEELAGWRFTMNDDQPVGPHYLYSAYPAGIGGSSAWQPFPHAELFLADVAGGVLAIGWIAQDESGLDRARAIFERVAPTLSLETPLDDLADPVPPLPIGEPQPPPEPAARPDGWPSTLSGLSKPVEAGEYGHLGFGTALSLTLGDGWWVQPNFPSWMVLTADESFGPGDRGLAFRSGISQLLPSIRSGGAGDGTPFDSQALMTTPPTNIEILESEQVAVDGAMGDRIRLAFVESADCAAGEICEYMVTSKYSFPPVSLRVGFQYEIWHLDQGLVEPITIIVESPDARWFPHAREVIDTLKFDTTD